MLTTTNHARFKFLRKALVLPVTLAALLALSCSTKEPQATPAVSVVIKNDTTQKPAPKTERIKMSGDVLFVINGKVISSEEAKKIKPDQIAAIYVLKDKAAIDKYGQPGANGVVEITLK